MARIMSRIHENPQGLTFSFQNMVLLVDMTMSSYRDKKYDEGMKNLPKDFKFHNNWEKRIEYSTKHFEVLQDMMNRNGFIPRLLNM